MKGNKGHILFAKLLLCGLAAFAEDGFLSSASSLRPEGAQPDPLEGARFVKHFSGDEAEGVRAFGEVRLGRELRGLELLKSRRRFGDGKSASILEKGYVIFGEEAAGESFTGENGEFTLHFRMRSKWGHWRYELLRSLCAELPEAQRGLVGKQGGASGLRFNYFGESLGALMDADFMKTSWGKRLAEDAEFSQNLIGVYTNLRGMDGSWWHEFTVRFDGVRLQLYVDGVLDCENYPISKIVNLRAPFAFPAHSYAAAQNAEKEDSAPVQDAQPMSLIEKFEGGAKFFEGDLDLFAIWDRALSLDEIHALSEGARNVALLEMDYIGMTPPSLYLSESQFPSSAYAASAAVFFKNRLFSYLMLEKHAPFNKWGLGGSVYTVSNTDEIGLYAQGGRVLDMDDKFMRSNEFADAVEADGKIYLFHTDRGVVARFKGEGPEGFHLRCSVSEDGESFARLPEVSLKLASSAYCALYFEDEGLFRVYSLDGYFYESADLKAWEKSKERWKDKSMSKLAWAEIFKFGDFYYLLGNAYGEIYRSKNHCGPWEKCAPFLTGGLMNPRVAVGGAKGPIRDKQRAILLGTVPKYSRSGPVGMRELRALPGGEICGVFASAFLPESRISDPLRLDGPSGAVSGVADAFSIRASKSASEVRARLSEVQKNYRMKLKIKVKNAGEGAEYGVVFNSREGELFGMRLGFEPQSASARLEDLAPSGKSGEGAKPYREYVKFKLADFECKKGVEIDAIRRNGVCDIVLGGRQSIVGMGRTNIEDGIEFYAKNCDIEVEGVEYIPFNEVQPRSELGGTRSSAPARRSRYSR